MSHKKSTNFITELLNPTPIPANDSTKSIKSAENKAKKIIIKATLKAKDIIENAELLDELLENEMNEALTQTLEKMSLMFEQMLQKSAASTLIKFEELLEIQLKASQKLILTSFEKSLEKVNDSLKEYEAKKKAQIDEVIHLEAKDLSRQIVADFMPENLQEKLINDAIAKAKTEGVFQ